MNNLARTILHNSTEFAENMPIYSFSAFLQKWH